MHEHTVESILLAQQRDYIFWNSQRLLPFVAFERNGSRMPPLLSLLNLGQRYLPHTKNRKPTITATRNLFSNVKKAHLPQIIPLIR